MTAQQVFRLSRIILNQMLSKALVFKINLSGFNVSA